jgi:hypothetical protein
MSRIKIRQLGERVATTGLFMGGGLERRCLEPAEVLDIPDTCLLEDGRNLLELLVATNMVELTLDAATRPLDYETTREAKLCSPTFNPRGPDEVVEVERARTAVAARMDELSEAPATVRVETPTEPDTPADDEKPAVTAKKASPKPAATKKKTKKKVAKKAPVNRRAARRAAVQAATNGTADTS